MPSRLPMFPLGTVVFPFSAVPLRVFEPRYLTLLERVEAGDGEFGTVLIERGFEVGGGDERFDIGTRVRVMGATELPMGHRAVVVAGTERIRIVEWQPDDPHPWALVEPLPDTTETYDVSELLEQASARLETAMMLASELGADTAEVDLTVSDDPAAASYQLAALSPILEMDSYELLSVPSVDERIARTIELLDDRIAMMRHHLAGDGR